MSESCADSRHWAEASRHRGVASPPGSVAEPPGSSDEALGSWTKPASHGTYRHGKATCRHFSMTSRHCKAAIRLGEGFYRQRSSARRLGGSSYRQRRLIYRHFFDKMSVSLVAMPGRTEDYCHFHPASHSQSGTAHTVSLSLSTRWPRSGSGLPGSRGWSGSGPRGRSRTARRAGRWPGRRGCAGCRRRSRSAEATGQRRLACLPGAGQDHQRRPAPHPSLFLESRPVPLQFIPGFRLSIHSKKSRGRFYPCAKR